MGKMSFLSGDDDRSCGNFWQRAKRRLRLARRSCCHEITSLHFRAAALPRSRRLLRHAYSDPVAHAKTEAASKTNRARKAVAESVSHSFRKAHLIPCQIKINPVACHL